MATLSSIELWGRDRFAHKRLRHCRVCLAEYDKDPEIDYTLCPSCLSEPATLLARIDAELARIRKERDLVCEAWVERQASLPEALGARWSALVAARAKVQTDLEHVRRGKRWSGRVIPAGALENAEEALAAVLSKIERTRKKDADISQLLAEDAAHTLKLDALHQDRCRWEMARSDLEVSQGREFNP